MKKAISLIVILPILMSTQMHGMFRLSIVRTGVTRAAGRFYSSGSRDTIYNRNLDLKREIREETRKKRDQKQLKEKKEAIKCKQTLTSKSGL